MSANHFEKISPENLEELKKHRNMLNEYVSLKDGESADWEIDPNRIEEVQDKFNADRTRVRFYVYDPNFDGEFKWDAPRSAARQITDMMYQKGTTFFHIERHGAGKETRYSVAEAK